MFQNPVVGSWFRTTHGCRGYDALPEGRLGADRRLIASEWWMPTDTYIGPVTEVKGTAMYVSVLVKGWWIDVWIRTRGNNGLGAMFANQVTETERQAWRDRGWRDTPADEY